MSIFNKINNLFYNMLLLEMNRLFSVTKSPILSHLGETIAGNSTIRAFNKTELYFERNYKEINNLILVF